MVIVLASGAPYHALYTWTACVGAAIAITLLVVLRAVVLREQTAIWVGTTGGRLVRRVKHSVDPEAWAAQAVDFRSHVLHRTRRGLPLSLLLLIVMVIVDGLLLAICLRCVGVSAGELPTLAVVGIFLVAYPLTLFPLAGVGILDATLLAAFVEIAGLPLEPDIVGGLVVYRVITLGVPMLFGLVSIALWRRTDGEKEPTHVPDVTCLSTSPPPRPRAQVSTGTMPGPETVRGAAHRGPSVLCGRDRRRGGRLHPGARRRLAGPVRHRRRSGSTAGRPGWVTATTPFTIQSVAKPFQFALVCEALGHREVRERIGVNATGLPFDSVMAVEIASDGLTNPMVNAGAIATTSLAPGRTAELKWRFLRDGLSRFAGRELEVDEEALASERATNGRNEAMARLLEGHGRMYFDPDETTDVYTRQGALLVTAADLALMGATLADGGVNPVTQRRVVSADTCRRTLALMLTAGLYELSGDWLYEVGLPAKSGVSGGIVTVAPGKGGLATFSPPLDAAGNSVRGQLATKMLSRGLGLDLLRRPRSLSAPTADVRRLLPAGPASERVASRGRRRCRSRRRTAPGLGQCRFSTEPMVFSSTHASPSAV